VSVSIRNHYWIGGTVGQDLDLGDLVAYACHMTQVDDQASGGRRVRLFRNGRSQAVRIPKEMEFPGGEVVVRKEGTRLIIDPAPTRSGLLSALASMKATDEQLPDIDVGLGRLDDAGL
jgi:antitoxin VapB